MSYAAVKGLLPNRIWPLKGPTNGTARALALASAISIPVLLGAAPARAAGVVGTGTPASCTRAALNVALAGGGNVTFNCGAASHTISFTLTKQISFDTAISGGGKIKLEALGTYHFKVLSGKTLRLENIELTGGNSNTAGAIENLGTALLSGVTFSDNTSTNKGGAILNRSILNVVKCTFRKNKAMSGGGAIWSEGGAVDVQESIFDQNQNQGGTSTPGGGGAIGSLAGTLTIAKCTFTDNSTAAVGGALLNSANASVKESTFAGNEASSGGAIFNGGSLAVDLCTLSGNQAVHGGGIAHVGALLVITASTLNGNAAIENGGGVHATGSAAYTNNTLSGNQAGSLGGGLFHFGGTAVMRFTTIAGNFAIAGAGAYKDSGGTLSLQNTLLANNVNGNCDGTMPTSLGNNLSSDTNCSTFTQPGDQQNVDAKLGPLANNGGPTKTHLPQAGSPAIEAAVMLAGVAKDQRGVNRPQPAGGKPDIGSVER